MICNPPGGATSGVGAGADDVQGLPLLSIYTKYRENISAKNPEGDLALGTALACADVGPLDGRVGRRLHGGKTLPQSSMNFPD